MPLTLPQVVFSIPNLYEVILTGLDRPILDRDVFYMIPILIANAVSVATAIVSVCVVGFSETLLGRM
jgi:hypothetical protein